MEKLTPAAPTVQRGFLLALLGTTLFSCKGILIKWCYQLGATPDVVIALRMVFAFPFYLAAAIRYRTALRKTPWHLLAFTAAFGLMGYFISSLLDLYALLYISASLERIILYTYPTLTLLMTVLVLKASLSRQTAVCILVIYAGLAVVFLNPASDGVTEGQNLWLGSGLVFAASFAYAIFLVGSEVLIRRMPSRLFTAVAMMSASLAIFVYSGLRLDLNVLLQQSSTIYALTLLIAIFCTVLPSFIVAAAIQRIGAAKTGAVGSAGPLITLILAVLLLGETVTPWQMLGFVIVMGGIYQLGQRRR